MRKGIATETIFYIVIGIVVVGLLTTLVISYTNNARKSGDCKTAESNYCSQVASGDVVNNDANWQATNGNEACGRNTAPKCSGYT